MKWTIAITEKNTPIALYTSTKVVIKLMYKLSKRIEAGAVRGVCVAIPNMNSMPNTNILELPHHKPQILLPLPRAQSTFPQALVLTGTRLPDAHLEMGMDGRTQSNYFVDRYTTHSFISILIAPRVFPQKILRTKVPKARSTPYIAVVIIKHREDKQTLTKSFSSPIFRTLTQLKLDACSAACAYIIRNFMAELKLLNNNVRQWIRWRLIG